MPQSEQEEEKENFTDENNMPRSSLIGVQAIEEEEKSETNTHSKTLTQNASGNINQGAYIS